MFMQPRVNAYAMHENLSHSTSYTERAPCDRLALAHCWLIYPSNKYNVRYWQLIRIAVVFAGNQAVEALLHLPDVVRRTK
jgi:hypothetical protein